MESKEEKLMSEKKIEDDFLDYLKKKRRYNKRIIEAFEFATEAHKDQKRASGEPYIVHPTAIAKELIELGLDSTTIISALLHDVLEDTKVSKKEIIEIFGEEIANIVDSLTKINDYTETKDNRKLEAVKKVLLASAKDIRVLLIKIYDRLHNMRTLNYLPEKKRVRIAQETMDIYVPIAQKLGLYKVKWEFEDLSFKYLNPEMYYYVKEKIKLRREKREKITKEIAKEIEELLKKEKVHFVKVLGRPKSFYSIFKKIKNKGKNIENLYDIYAVRIITKTIQDCYHILYIIHQHFNVFPNRLKDYITNPKENGYQSIHTVIFSEKVKMPVEIQIRTEEMHKLAEFGIAAHWRYKHFEKDKIFDKKIDWLREVMEWIKSQENNEEFLNLLKFKFFEDEIFVFTPKNDVITLPEGSTPIDFAYIIHTEVGDHTVRAKVNGEVVPLDKILKNGDIVEIITDQKARPNERWLNFVKTSKARFKIREALNLKHSGKSSSEVISDKSLLDLIKIPENYKKVKIAKCCKIKRGEPIVGVLNKNKELVIHNVSCENAKYTINKKVSLSWKDMKNKNIILNIVLEERIGLIMDLLNKIAEENVNIEKVNSKSTKDSKFRMQLTLSNVSDVDKLIKKIKEMDNLISITKSKPGFLFF